MDRSCRIWLYLRSNDYMVDVMDDRKVSFTCNLNHTTTLAIQSFLNKKTKYGYDPRLLCRTCNHRGMYFMDHFNKIKDTVMDRSGHEVLSLVKGGRVEYKCGTCGSINVSSHINLINKHEGSCFKCNGSKYPLQNIVRQLSKRGLIYSLISISNHNITIKCINGHKYDLTFKDALGGDVVCKVCNGYD